MSDYSLFSKRVTAICAAADVDNGGRGKQFAIKTYTPPTDATSYKLLDKDGRDINNMD